MNTYAPAPKPTPDVARTFRFPYHANAWDFMRAVDRSGGDATAGFPGLDDHTVRVRAHTYALAWLEGLAVEHGGNDVRPDCVSSKIAE
jgi:hypothetical protein